MRKIKDKKELEKLVKSGYQVGRYNETPPVVVAQFGGLGNGGAIKLVEPELVEDIKMVKISNNLSTYVF